MLCTLPEDWHDFEPSRLIFAGIASPFVKHGPASEFVLWGGLVEAARCRDEQAWLTSDAKSRADYQS